MTQSNTPFNKVAKITLLFWLMKIIATTLGETIGDFIAQTLDLGYTIGILVTLSFFLVVLVPQLVVKRYIPTLYWLVIIGTTTLGTEISDFIDRTLQLGYTAGTVLLVAGLAFSLALWYQHYRDLRVYPIIERRKEAYYWLAVLFSNSLGTAFGDFLGEYFGLSYQMGALVTGAVIIVVAMLHRTHKVNPVLLFWLAFVFTRPFGATFGDFLTKPLDKGGLDLGTLNASLASIALMAIMLVIAHRRERRER